MEQNTLNFAEFAPRAEGIIRTIAANEPFFNADDVRRRAAALGINPASPNYWGSVFAAMSANGEIAKHGGTLNSRRYAAKARLLQGWRGAACLSTRERARNVLRRFFGA